MSQRQIKAPKRYGFDNIVIYALQVVEEIDSFKSTTYQEAISHSEVEDWIMAMNEGSFNPYILGHLDQFLYLGQFCNFACIK